MNAQQLLEEIKNLDAGQFEELLGGMAVIASDEQLISDPAWSQCALHLHAAEAACEQRNAANHLLDEEN